MTRIGRFFYIRPEEIAELQQMEDYFNAEIEFSIVAYESKSWRDWFDVEGKGDGELLGVLGTVINERTFKKYASI
jgi:hypothetical protein